VLLIASASRAPVVREGDIDEHESAGPIERRGPYPRRRDVASRPQEVGEPGRGAVRDPPRHMVSLEVEVRVQVHAAMIAAPRSVGCLAHSRSISPRRRCAARARSSAADAPYRDNIVRDFQPASRMRSPSVPPEASQAWAKV
jgi:hypothetical protein